jgi:NitT/TauT family transport system substrate-binding protein
MPRLNRIGACVRILAPALCLLAAALAATPNLRAQDAPLRIAVNATTIESAPVFAAAKSLGPMVQLVRVTTGRAALAQLVRGEIDATTGSETQALLNSTAEPGLRIVLTLAECRYRMVSRKSAGIRSTTDLRGKKIATTANTSAHYFLLEMLRSAGLAESDVTVIPMEGPDMPPALARGDVDAFSIWEPHAQNALDMLGPDAVELRNATGYREFFNLNTTVNVLNDPAKRAALIAFMRAVDEASERIRNRPEEAVSALAPEIDATERTISSAWSRFQFPADLGAGLPAALEAVEQWAAKVQNRAPRARQALAELIDDSVLNEARQARSQPR